VESDVVRAIWDVAPAEEVGTGSVLDVLPGGSRTALAWSPDGRTLAFIGVAAGLRKIYVRDLGSDMSRPLGGTEGAQALAISSDGQSVAFFADGAIRRVRIGGGPPSKVCDAAPVSGISWGAARLAYTAGTRLFTVSPEGGEPRMVHESTLRLSSPSLLPGDTAVLFTEYGRLWTSGDERVLVQSLSGDNTSKVLLAEAADARYLTTGHLAFLRRGTIFVTPFNAEALDVHSGEEAVLKGVAQAVTAWTGTNLTLAGQYAVSPQGTLAYLRGEPQMPTSELVAVDRRGSVTPLGAAPGVYRERMQVSPDGTSLAFSTQTARDVRLMVFDRLRKTAAPLLLETAGREVFAPAWSRDGRIAASVGQGGTVHVEEFRPGSAGTPRPVEGSEGFIASSWSADGTRLVGTRAGDLWTYSTHGESGAWTQLTRSQSIEWYPAWSPDDRWLVYTSNVTGAREVYVQAYPKPGVPVPVSTNGGVGPVWNPNGREVFYIEGQGMEDRQHMMAVDMSNPLRPGIPVRLFSFSVGSLLLAPCSPTACYSVASDGDTFFTLRVLPRQPARVTEIHLVFNWFEEVKRLVGTPES
jgi:serine/threonine-protein kinase